MGFEVSRWKRDASGNVELDPAKQAVAGSSGAGGGTAGIDWNKPYGGDPYAKYPWLRPDSSFASGLPQYDMYAKQVRDESAAARARQQQFIDQMYANTMGRGLAQVQLQQATEQNAAQALGIAGSMRGMGAGAQQMMAANQAAAARQQMAGQSALTQLQAQQLYGQALMNMDQSVQNYLRLGMSFDQAQLAARMDYEKLRTGNAGQAYQLHEGKLDRDTQIGLKVFDTAANVMGGMAKSAM